jgi:hypothetical protein
LILMLCCSSPASGRAQTSLESGARAAALGGAATALAHEATGYANPAAWATFSGRAVSFFASEAFGLPELRLGTAAYVEPTRLGTFAVGAQTFGFEDYRETHVQVGFARGFRLGTTRRFLIGVSLRYHRLTIPEYGSAGAPAVGLGGLVTIRPSVQAGFQATNMHVPRLAGREALARTLALGLAYRPTERVLVVIDAAKDVRFPLSVRAGLEVQPVAVLCLRAGAATEPARFTAGMGLRLGKLAADVAGEHHDALGWSPAVSFGLYW